MIRDIGYFGLKYFTECPVDAVRLIKAVPFDWASQIGCMPKSLDGLYNLVVVIDEYSSLKDFFDAGKDFVHALGCLENFFSLSLSEILKGDRCAIREAINLTSEALNVAAIFGSKLKFISSTTANYLEIASSLVSVVKDLQDLYRILMNTEVEGQQNAYFVSLSLARNSLSISRSVLQVSIRQYLLLSCGSIYSITKVALFVLNNKN